MSDKQRDTGKRFMQKRMTQKKGTFWSRVNWAMTFILRLLKQARNIFGCDFPIVIYQNKGCLRQKSICLNLHIVLRANTNFQAHTMANKVPTSSVALSRIFYEKVAEQIKGKPFAKKTHGSIATRLA